MYEWKEYGMSFTTSEGPKHYGPVRLKSGRVIYRKYKQELKNGKGMSLADLLAMNIRESNLRMSLSLAAKAYKPLARQLYVAK